MTRDVADNRIDVWKDAYKDGQRTWRAARNGRDFGQVLRGNARPSDQPVDGPLLPANLRNDGWIDVYRAPEGYGWRATFEAVEGSVVYNKSVSCHENRELVIGPWIIQEPITTPTRHNIISTWEKGRFG